MRLNFVGDIMLGRGVAEILREKGTDHLFSGLRDELPTASGTIGNLEAPFTCGGTAFRGKATNLTFRVDPGLARALARMGITSVTLANNHAVDYGLDGIRSTLETLKSNGQLYTGVGHDIEDAIRPIIFEDTDSGQRIGLFAFNAFVPFSRTAGKKRYGVARLDERTVASALDHYKNSVTGVILSVHWGIDYHPFPVPALIKRIKGIMAAYPEILAVVGHHPHIQQPVIEYFQRPIFCSLGNFLFDEPFPPSRLGSILTLDIENNRLKDYSLKFMRLTDDFRMIPLEQEAVQKERKRLDGICYTMRRNDEEYTRTDWRWIRYLLYQSLHHRSINDLSFLTSLYSPQQILRGLVQ